VCARVGCGVAHVPWLSLSLCRGEDALKALTFDHTVYTFK
jgi:hypothetical protein